MADEFRKITRRSFGKQASGLALAIGGANVACTSKETASIPGDRKVTQWEPKIAENIGNLDDDTLTWQAQMGHKWVVLQGTDWVDQDKKGYWTTADLKPLQEKCAGYDLHLNTIMIPIEWLKPPMFGAPDRDKYIENIQRSVRAGAEAGIEVFEWRWSPDFKWGADVGYYDTTGRGGAMLKAFDYNRVKDAPPFDDLGTLSKAELQARMVYFAKPVAEAAEMAGARISCHPKDPPVKVMRGIERLITNTDEIEAFAKAIDSPAHGFTFCQGTVTEMGVDVPAAIRRIGGMGKIHHVHFRGVRGSVPEYVETFIDEGDVDMLEAMRAYRDVEYPHTMVSDHTPKVVGDFGGGRIGRSFSQGYIRGLIQAVNAEREAV